jgi:pimeloyl-ACP methyl ester carboxylesterase
MTERYLTFRDYRIFCHDAGTGEALLFLHNAGNDHRIWEHQLEHFADRYHVVALDSLGYGRSDRPRISYTLALYRDMVAMAVDTLALAPVTIIGNCTGASMALAYGLEHPERVRRLLLFNLATEKTIRDGNIEAQYRLLAGKPRLTRLVAPLIEGLMVSRSMTWRILRGQYGGVPPQDPEFEEHCHRLYGQRGSMSAYLDLICHWQSLRPLDEAVSKDLPPVHVIWGEQNQVLPAEGGRAFCERFEPEALEVVPGCGHLVMRENPSWVNETIETILMGTGIGEHPPGVGRRK